MSESMKRWKEILKRGTAQHGNSSQIKSQIKEIKGDICIIKRHNNNHQQLLRMSATMSGVPGNSEATESNMRLLSVT